MKDTMALSRRLRFEILRRDNYTCRYCGRSSPDVTLQVDHVLASTLGGTDDPTNLVTACVDCNSGKSSTGPHETVVADVRIEALRWAKAVEEAAGDRGRHRQSIIDAHAEFTSRWEWHPPDDWKDTVERFVRLGLAPADIGFIADKANRRGSSADHAFRYFCKVAWSEITEIQKRAHELLGTPVSDHQAPAPTVDQGLACGTCSRPLLDPTDSYKEEHPDWRGHQFFCSPECMDAALTPDEPVSDVPIQEGFCIECDAWGPVDEQSSCPLCRARHFEVGN